MADLPRLLVCNQCGTVYSEIQRGEGDECCAAGAVFPYSPSQFQKCDGRLTVLGPHTWADAERREPGPMTGVHVVHDYDEGWLVEVLVDGEWECAWNHYAVDRCSTYDSPFTRSEARKMAREVRRQIARRVPSGSTEAGTDG